MIAEQFDTFLFDLDGVVYVGTDALPGAPEALQRLRRQGKAIRFLTNDPRPTREGVVARLARFGIEAHTDEIITSGWATAVYLRENGFRTVSIVGSEDLGLEMERAGLRVTDADAEAVAVGSDVHVGYMDFQRATSLILRGARFVATNVDASFPMPDGLYPGTGAIVSAIETASGVEPVIVGKPYPAMFEAALLSARGRRAVMIGDRPEVDILGAHQAGIPAILVADEPAAFPVSRDFRTPDAVVRDLSELFVPDRSVRRWKPPAFSWPERVAPGVGAVALDAAGQVLLVRRRDLDLWSLPMGRIEPGESVEEAVRRELLEETGARAKNLRLMAVYSEPRSQSFTHPTGRTIQYVTCCFLCHVNGNALRPDGKEISSAAFFDPRRLPDDLLPVHRQWMADALEQEAFLLAR